MLPAQALSVPVIPQNRAGVRPFSHVHGESGTDGRQVGVSFISTRYAGNNESVVRTQWGQPRAGVHPTVVTAGGTHVDVVEPSGGGRMLAAVLLPGVGK